QRDTLRLGRAGTRVRQGGHAQATQEADTLAAAAPSTGEMQYPAACIYSLSVAACLADTRLSQAEQQALAEQYAGRAMALLAKAQALGFFRTAGKREQVAKDTDLDPLRSREDFQKWLRELER